MSQIIDTLALCMVLPGDRFVYLPVLVDFYKSSNSHVLFTRFLTCRMSRIEHTDICKIKFNVFTILLYLFVPFHPQQKFKLPHGGVVVFILCVSVFYFVCEMNECLYVGNTSAQVNKSQVVPSFKVLVSDIFSRYDDVNFYCIIYLLNEGFFKFYL